MINGSAELIDVYPNPHQRTFDIVFGGLTTLLRVEYLQSLLSEKDQVQDLIASSPDYPCPERQVQLQKNLQIMDDMLSNRSKLPLHSLFGAVARHNLNITSVFVEYRWSNNEISTELLRLKSTRKVFARFATEADLGLLDQLCDFLEKFLNPPGLEVGERYEDLEKYFSAYY